MSFTKIYLACIVSAITAFTLNAQVDSNFHCYLLFGQSNMAGGGAGVPIGGSGAGTLITADCDTSPRVKVLAFSNCNAGAISACSKYKAISRTADKWYTAYPALHDCAEGVSPGDWFAKTMLDSIRDDIKIGLIPCALSGMALTVFLNNSGAKSTVGPPDVNGKNAYAWMLARCKLAQQTGVIKGMFLHQGESGPGGQQWVTTATQIFNDLKKDLGLPSALPVVVGELRQDNYADFNKNSVNAFAKSYQYCGVASSVGAGVQNDDVWHFNPEGMRLLGKHYAQAFLALADNKLIPRKGEVAISTPKIPRVLSSKALVSLKDDARIFTLDGKAVPTLTTLKAGARSGVRPGNVYLVKQNTGSATKVMIAP